MQPANVEMHMVLRTGLTSIAALVGVAGLALLGHRLFKSQAPKVQEVWHRGG